MTTLLELASPNPAAEDLDARFTTFLESWRSNFTSTDRADRPAAEAAMEGLYRNVGRARPRILWVASPLAAAMAAVAVRVERHALQSPYVRGDIGTGSNQSFYAAASPFGFPLPVERAIEGRIRDRSTLRQREALSQAQALATNVTVALGVEVRAQVRTVLTTMTSSSGGSIDLDQVLGKGLLGSSAEPFAQMVGTEVFSMVAADAVREAFLDRLRPAINDRWTLQAMQAGQFDATIPRWASLETVHGSRFYSPTDGSLAHRERLALQTELTRSAGPWWALDDLAIISERPLAISIDDRERLHSADGPALAYGDGFTVHAWHGTNVPRQVIEAPESLTVGAIDAEENSERRRVMIDRFGADRLVREGNAELVNEDETGRLWRRPLTRTWVRGRYVQDVVAMVEVVNSTPEPDGSRKTYFLRVPPTMTSAREAVAWTFRMRADEYEPVAQT